MEQGMGCFESFVRWERSGEWEEAEHLYEGNEARYGRERSICTEETKRGMGGDGSFVRYFRSGGWEVTNRLYEGNEAGDGR